MLEDKILFRLYSNIEKFYYDARISKKCRPTLSIAPQTKNLLHLLELFPFPNRRVNKEERRGYCTNELEEALTENHMRKVIQIIQPNLHFFLAFGI